MTGIAALHRRIIGPSTNRAPFGLRASDTYEYSHHPPVSIPKSRHEPAIDLGTVHRLCTISIAILAARPRQRRPEQLNAGFGYSAHRPVRAASDIHPALARVAPAPHTHRVLRSVSLVS
jgi:hypothetical protein